MQTRRFVFPLLLIAFLAAVPALAQTPAGTIPTDKPQEFRFISTTKTATFEKELNEAAKQGFGFIRLAKAFNDGSLGGLLSRENSGCSSSICKVLSSTHLSSWLIMPWRSAIAIRSTANSAIVA